MRCLRLEVSLLAKVYHNSNSDFPVTAFLSFIGWRYNISISITITGLDLVLGSLSVSLCGKAGCSSLYTIYRYVSLLYSGLRHGKLAIKATWFYMIFVCLTVKANYKLGWLPSCSLDLVWGHIGHLQLPLCSCWVSVPLHLKGKWAPSGQTCPLSFLLLGDSQIHS